jgi:hypothetical protein
MECEFWDQKYFNNCAYMNKKIEIDLDFDRVNEKINSKEWKNLWFKI